MSPGTARRHEGGGAGQGGASLCEVIESSHEPEVSELGPAVRGQEDIGGFDVAVDESGVVCGLDAQPDLLGKDGGAEGLEWSLADQRFPQGEPAWHIFHFNVMKAVQASQVMNGHDMRVDQVGGRSGLGPELLTDSRLFKVERRIHDLQRAVAAQSQVTRFVDAGH